jgi:DNA-binding transcriptional regulator YiaG
MATHLGRALATDEHVHHRDGDHTNNDLSNLELLTARDHQHHHHLGRSMNAGEANQNAKLTRAQVKEIRASTLTQQALAELYGVHRQAISKIRRGTRW